MFITLQLPLFDRRYLFPEINRVDRPNWEKPESSDRVRFVGSILDRRNLNYRGPWDGEKYYCNASGVIALCGLGEKNYFKSLKSQIFDSDLIFRRLQSDGHFMVKFEIGWSDWFENTLQTENKSALELKQEVHQHIASYLECQVKIKIGGKRHSDYLPLGESGNQLKNAYYWASTPGIKSFNIKDLKHQVESLDPVIIIHMDQEKFNLDALGFKLIHIQGLKEEGLALYFDRIPFHGKDSGRVIETWIITSKDGKITFPTEKQDFASFSPVLRSLRMNLLKVPTEAQVLQKLNSLLNDVMFEDYVSDPKVQKRVARYIHKSLTRLCANTQFNQDQKAIVQTSLELDENMNPRERVDILNDELHKALDWFKTIPATPENENMFNQLKEKYNELNHPNPNEIHRVIIKKQNPVIFFSYAWGDEKEIDESREKLINDLYDSLSGDGFELRRDKMNLQYGGLITDFMKEIGEGDLIFIGLSQKYLKSKYCMWELCEIWRNSKDDKKLFIPKLLPLMIEQLNLSSIDFLAEHLDYWNAQFNKISEFIAKYPQQVGQTQQDEHRRIRSIKDNFAEIIGLVADINTLTKDLIKEGDFKVIRETILERIKV